MQSLVAGPEEGGDRLPGTFPPGLEDAAWEEEGPEHAKAPRRRMPPGRAAEGVHVQKQAQAVAAY